MPVLVGVNVPNPASTFQAQGSIDVINITTAGEGYTSGGVNISILGDGQYANGTALVNAAGYLYDVSMANTGQGYTFSQVNISPSAGYPAPNVQAIAIAPTSPIGGHGFDPVSELGCNSIMVSASYIENINGALPTDFEYRQVGLLVDPISVKSISQPVANFANTDFFDATTHLYVSPGTGAFSTGQTIYQGSDVNNASFIAKIVSFDAAANMVRVINMTGVPTPNQAVIQDANGPIQSAIRTLLTVQDPDFITFSGYMAYIENRQPIQRSADGTEQFRIVLRF